MKIEMLENDKIKVEFSKETGDICSFFNKETNQYIIDKPCRAVLLDESAYDTWGHETDSLGPVCGVFGRPKFIILEDGKVRATLRVITRCGNSVVERDYSIRPGSKEVTVKAKIKITKKNKTLKFTFPTKGENVISQIPYGTFERQQNTGEEPFGMWFACGKLCVANDSKYGYDTENGDIRLSVLRTATYADHYGQPKRDEFSDYMDMDTHEFKYSVFPFTTKTCAEKTAAELNMEPKKVMASFHKGNLPLKDSFIDVKDDSVIVSAIKKAEDGEDAVIRFFEMEGKDTTANITLFRNNTKTDINHNQIKTLNISKNGVKEINICEF